MSTERIEEDWTAILYYSCRVDIENFQELPVPSLLVTILLFCTSVCLLKFFQLLASMKLGSFMFQLPIHHFSFSICSERSGLSSHLSE